MHVTLICTSCLSTLHVDCIYQDSFQWYTKDHMIVVVHSTKFVPIWLCNMFKRLCYARPTCMKNVSCASSFQVSFWLHTKYGKCLLHKLVPLYIEKHHYFVYAHRGIILSCASTLVDYMWSFSPNAHKKWK